METKTKWNYSKYPSQTENEQKLTRVGLKTSMPSPDQNIICALLKKNCFHFHNFNHFL